MPDGTGYLIVAAAKSAVEAGRRAVLRRLRCARHAIHRNL
jgi:hypothetical protein